MTLRSSAKALATIAAIKEDRPALKFLEASSSSIRWFTVSERELRTSLLMNVAV